MIQLVPMTLVFLFARLSVAEVVMVLSGETRDVTTVKTESFVIGKLFDIDEAVELSALNTAILYVNNNDSLLKHVRLIPKGLPLPQRDAYYTGQGAYVLHVKRAYVLHDKVYAKGGLLFKYIHGNNIQINMQKAIAIFGPKDYTSSKQVQALSEAKEVPNFLTFWQRGKIGSEVFSVNLYPPAMSVGDAVLTLVEFYGWKSFGVFYQDDMGLVQLQNLLQIGVTESIKRHSVVVNALTGLDHRQVLKEARSKRFVVHAKAQNVIRLMNQAAELGMLNGYHYIFTDLDTYTMDLSEYRREYPGCNITTLRLVDVESNHTAELRLNLQKLWNFTAHEGIPTSAAIVYDGVYLLALALNALEEVIRPAVIDCNAPEQTWRNGSTLINFIRTVSFNGSSGKVMLDSYGNRIDYQYNFLELSEDGFEKVATWHNKDGLRPMVEDPKTIDLPVDLSSSLKKTAQNVAMPAHANLRISVYVEEPFVMLKQEEGVLQGNDRYEGYAIDLLNEIAKIWHFNYTIHPVRDNSYGSRNENGDWNGIVGELVRGEADLGLAALTISYSRSEVIDFTVPYMHLGISILFKKAEKQDPHLFSFLSPLSLSVWLYMVTAYVGVSLLLWLVARFTPYEWQNQNTCHCESDLVVNQFSLLNSFWFTAGSLMQQGCEVSPRAMSTRLIAGVWWFFVLILISSYTANLAAFLTVERMVLPIENADDLAKQTRIKYGSLNRGSTMTFFKESQIQTYETMWRFMQHTEPSVFVSSSKEGIDRVKAGDYAYLMESTMLEYYVERQCDLMQVGGLLDSKGYGIALQKGSPYKDAMSMAILILQEKTKLTSLKERWWRQKRGGGLCLGTDLKKGQPGALGLGNVGGVFVLLLFGVFCAAIISILEHVLINRNLAKRRTHKSAVGQGLCAQMWDALKFALRSSATMKRRPSTNVEPLTNAKALLNNQH